MSQRGFTLVELIAGLVIASLSLTVLVMGLVGRAKRAADLDSVKNLITMASRRSVAEAKHYGVHFDSTLHTAGLFEDRNSDNSFSGSDTLSAITRLNPLGSLSIANTSATRFSDVCFKKNGATGSGDSFELVYVGDNGDSAKMQIIAASGRLLGH
jgi:prepilin-type N-terminal cleavage/methylation domain-containing protein